MRRPRFRLSMRWMIAIVAVSALLMGAVAAMSRIRRHVLLEAEAQGHEFAAARRRAWIPRDLFMALVCARLALRGEPAPQPFVPNIHGDDAEKRCHETFVRLSESQNRTSSFAPVSTWPDEAIWWLAEAGRDAIRADWHTRLHAKYSQAATRGRWPVAPDPPIPFPYFPYY